MNHYEIVPALVYKDEILEECKKILYTDRYFYYSSGDHNPINIRDNDDGGNFQYAIIEVKYTETDVVRRVIGYFAYTLNMTASAAYNFGLLSFDDGNPRIGLAVKELFQDLIDKYQVHRIEFWMIGGNPVEEVYDWICDKYHGSKHHFHDVLKDAYGNYHDSFTYEIINPNKDEPKHISHYHRMDQKLLDEMKF